MITTAALFAGFYAIVQAMNNRFEAAAVAIFVAMVFDGLDGRVARLTRTQSAFGAEFDSLSDMVSFGVAPALVIYEWALQGMGKLGWIAAFVYCACAALRLARFNTNIDVVDKRFFQGLPSPAAAALVAGLRLVHGDLRPTSGADVRWLAWALTVFAGADDGEQRALLQRQGHQPAQERAVLRGGADRARRGARVLLRRQPARAAVHRSCRSTAASGYVFWVVTKVRRQADRAAPSAASRDPPARLTCPVSEKLLYFRP